MSPTTPGQPDEQRRAALRELAEAYGVAAEYWSFFGERVEVDDATLVAVLEALGVPASSPELVRVHLAHRADAPWRRMLPPTVVAREGAGTTFPVHVDHGDPVDVWIELEDGGTVPARQVDRVVEPRTVDGRLVGEATFAVPDDVPLGWHVLRASSGSRTAHATLAVTPARLRLPRTLRKGARAWGLMAQLYSVRSRESWGIGDFADLGDLAWLSARRAGADFLLVNPLHAAEPLAPLTPSPYLPTTRRFVSPLYVRPEDIRETAYLSAADRSLVEWSFDTVRELDTDPGPVDRDTVWTAKRSALEVVFAHPRSTARQSSLDAFRAREGQGLEDFALWCALVDHFGGADPQGWADEALDPSSALVEELREQLADRVDFYVWLQWVADEQLERAQRAALEGGMSLGVVHDLAVGVHPFGADAWALRRVLATGVGVGAPPDMYNQQGQNWSQPPWNPVELERVGYAPYRDMLRTVLRHAGGVRVDHILGLFRLWWIPDGMGADRGTYVRFDHEALVGILCLEAERAGAVVIGEDLGTVEPWIRDHLADRGILGTSILWFEQRDGAPLPPEEYRRLALTTVTTHDLPPTPAYLAGEHVELRERLGLLTQDPEIVRRDARREREAFVRALHERGLVGDEASEREVVEALHAFVAASPSVLLGVSLTDATGERRAQNQPGTDQEYPNWKIPLADGTGQPVLLDDLFDSPRLRSLLAVVQQAVHPEGH